VPSLPFTLPPYAPSRPCALFLSALPAPFCTAVLCDRPSSHTAIFLSFTFLCCSCACDNEGHPTHLALAWCAHTQTKSAGCRHSFWPRLGPRVHDDGRNAVSACRAIAHPFQLKQRHAHAPLSLIHAPTPCERTRTTHHNCSLVKLSTFQSRSTHTPIPSHARPTPASVLTHDPHPHPFSRTSLLRTRCLATQAHGVMVDFWLCARNRSQIQHCRQGEELCRHLPRRHHQGPRL
jgi:hypothetical protein